MSNLDAATSLNIEQGSPLQVLRDGNEVLAAALLDLRVAHVFGVSGKPITSLGGVIQESHPGFEWSLNEKVATEAAIGVSASGARSAILMKECGLHVALDPIINAAHHGIGGGVVAIVGDDIRAASSTILQDTRPLAKFAGLPAIELTPGCDIAWLVSQALMLSEHASIPVVLRTSRDLTLARSGADFGCVLSPQEGGHRINQHVAHGLTKFGRFQNHRVHVWPRVESFVDARTFTRERHRNQCRAGVVVVGHMSDAVRQQIDSGELCAIETDVCWPVPTSVRRFANDHDDVCVIEEPLAFLEEQLLFNVAALGDSLRLRGRLSGQLPSEGPLHAEDIAHCIAGGQVSVDARLAVEVKPHVEPDKAHPYHALFVALSSVAADGTFISTDVGSSVKLCYPPYDAADVALCLGSPVAISAGHTRATGKPGIAVIGDFGLLHSGLEGVLEMVHRGIPGVIVVLANGIAAQTGGFDNMTAVDRDRAVRLETVFAGLGVEQIDRWRTEALDSDVQAARLKKLLQCSRVAVAIVDQGKGIA